MTIEQRAKTYVCRLISGLVESDLRATSQFGQAGLRHHVLRIDGPSSELPVTVRINADASDSERAKSQRENSVLSALSGRCAPVVLDFDNSGNLFPEPALCLEFVEGEIYDVGKLDSSALGRFGREIAGLHDTVPDVGVRDAVSIAGVRDYADHFNLTSRQTVREIELMAENHPGEPNVIRFKKAIESAGFEQAGKISESSFRVDEPLALLHGDLVNANIVWMKDGKFKLIDWEDVRIGDPAEDIAYFFTENHIGDIGRSSFWTGYTQQSHRDIDSLRSRTDTWMKLVVVASGLWWLRRYCEPLPGESLPREFFLTGVEERLQWLEAA